MSEIQVGVAVDEINQSLAGIPSSTNEGNLGGVVLLLVLNPEGRIGVGGGRVRSSARDSLRSMLV